MLFAWIRALLSFTWLRAWLRPGAIRAQQAPLGAVERVASARTTEPRWGQQAQVQRHRVTLVRRAMGGFRNPDPQSRLALQLATGVRVEVDLFQGQTPAETLERLRVKLRWRGYDVREVPADGGHRAVAFYVVRDEPARLATAG
jgi:hypothetical protein